MTKEKFSNLPLGRIKATIDTGRATGRGVACGGADSQTLCKAALGAAVKALDGIGGW